MGPRWPARCAARRRAWPGCSPTWGARRPLVARLERLLVEPAPGRDAMLHGDFSPDQVLAQAGEAAVVDLDGAARGEPLVDLAWFEGSLLADAAMAGLDRGRAQRAFRALLEGYQTVSALDHRHRLAGLHRRRPPAPGRRAVPAARRPTGPRRSAALLTEAEAMVDSGAEVATRS